MTTQRRCGCGSAAAVALCCLTVAAVPAHARDRDAVGLEDCVERQAFAHGDESAVRARLPERYEPVRDPAGPPVVFARAIRCRRVAVGPATSTTTLASFGVVIESPDGSGCLSSTPGVGGAKGDVPPACNWYLLFWVTDNRRLVRWLLKDRRHLPVRYVRSFVWREGAFAPLRAGAPFRFAAPAPTPSPFALSAVARERPAELALSAAYWADTPEGTVRVTFSSPAVRLGEASGTVRAAPGSEMAALLGATMKSYAPGWSLFAANRWAAGAYRASLDRRRAPPRS